MNTTTLVAGALVLVIAVALLGMWIASGLTASLASVGL